jgi:hypothetical protein
VTRPRRWRAAWAPGAALVAGLATAGAAAADSGPRASLSALLGTALVVGFLGSGVVPLLLVRGQQSSAALGAGVLLLNYTLRLAVAVVVLRVASRSDAVDLRWTGLAVIASALAWAVGQAVAVLRTGHDPAGHGQPGGDG